jgi:C_GCAxxG_C_C family probable redox protein
MVKAVTEVFARQQTQDLALAGSALCGGMGNYKVTCGVFTGGAVAVGLVAGGDPGKKRDKRIREVAMRFQELLEQEAGGHVCEDLLAKMGLWNFNKRLCKRLTRQGAEMLAGLIIESGLDNS